jgi:hypothetical protein
LAVEKRIPVLAFVHEKPGGTEKNDSKDAAKWTCLLKFRDRVMDGRLNALYKDKADLAVKVMQSLTDAFNSKPRTGWVRGDKLVSDSSAREILELRNEIARLKQSSEISEFASGSDTVTLTILASLQSGDKAYECTAEWDWIFDQISGSLFDGDNESGLARRLGEALARTKKIEGGMRGIAATLDHSEFRRVVHQFMVLGLVERRPDRNDIWTLTEKGEHKFLARRAQKKDREKPSAA